VDAGNGVYLLDYTAWNGLTDKKVDLLTLQLQLVQAGIALEVASGLYRDFRDSNGKSDEVLF
jgi:cobalt-zinc-cadmium efflux system outer membrane protein